MPWKALKKLLEMKGIRLAHEDGEKLHRQLRVKGDNELVSYKEALSYLQPNYDLEDPIRSVWLLRKTDN